MLDCLSYYSLQNTNTRIKNYGNVWIRKNKPENHIRTTLFLSLVAQSYLCVHKYFQMSFKSMTYYNRIQHNKGTWRIPPHSRVPAWTSSFFFEIGGSEQRKTWHHYEQMLVMNWWCAYLAQLGSTYYVLHLSRPNWRRNN